MHSTNAPDTFIGVAPDSAAAEGMAPKKNAVPTIAWLTFTMIHQHPYRYTSDEVLFTVHAERKGIPRGERAAARVAFFGKGQPCLRASELGKRYGWGVHADAKGRVALYGVDTAEYRRLVRGQSLRPGGAPVTVKFAMRSAR